MNILGIRFSAHGVTSYYSAGMCAQPIAPGQLVVVECEQSLALGEVLHVCDTAPQDVNPETLPCVLRLADAVDAATAYSNTLLAEQARAFCQGCIRERNLDMKLVDVEIFYDRSKIIFYFTAPARIDFRELVKDLVREYRSRIELRQIGVRHETQMIGAVGNCGMVCCCRRFLRKFAPVTIRMAKEQNLFLNPAKISGICGRLLCCLSYEQENYDTFHRTCPRLGKKYTTNNGPMKVLRANMFRNTVSVLSEHNEELEFTLEEWQELAPRRPDNAVTIQPLQPKAAVHSDADDGFLVVSVDPAHIEELSLLDDMPLAHNGKGDGRGIFGLAPAMLQVSAPQPESPESKSRRRKRRKRSRNEGNEGSESGDGNTPQ